jgi:hypothetical protein
MRIYEFKIIDRDHNGYLIQVCDPKNTSRLSKKHKQYVVMDLEAWAARKGVDSKAASRALVTGQTVKGAKNTYRVGRYRLDEDQDDIIQTQQPAAAKPSFLQRLSRNRSEAAEQAWLDRLPLGADIGDGIEAVAFKHRSDPALIVKVERKPTDPATNAYYQYVRAIQPLMSNNPYLPRIYVADSFKTEKGVRFAYTMERLYDAYKAVSHIHPDLFKSFANRLFVNPPDTESSRSIYGGWTNVIREINHVVRQGDYSNIRDRKLVQACQLINQLKQGIDLHSGNLMIRYTGVGPQIVITDPVVGSN